MISTKICAPGFVAVILLVACGPKTEGKKIEPVAEPPAGEVSLSIGDVSIRNLESFAMVEMRATMDNGTGQTLFVITNFYSPFDGLALVVESAQGFEVLRLPYIYHQSPHLPDGTGLPLKPGPNTERMGFPLEKKLPEGSYRVRLEGGLPGTRFTEGITSNWVEVVLKGSKTSP